MVFITALALCAAIYAIRCIYVAFFKLEISSVPGPFLAKFTDLYSLFQAYKSTRTRWLQDLHRQHGSLVRIAPNRFSVSDPKALSDIYDLKHEYPKSDQMETLNTVINGRINQGLVPTRDKKLHTMMRRPVAHQYSMSAVSQYEHAIDETIGLFARRLDDEFVVKQTPCKIDEWIHYYSYDVVTAITLGTRQGFLEQGGDVDDMLRDLNKSNYYIGLVMNAPFWDWVIKKNPISINLPTSINPIVVRARDIVLSRLGSKSHLNADGKKDMLSTFIDLSQAKPNDVPEARVISYVAINLLAGSDTTAVTLRSVIYRLLKNRDSLSRVQKELDTAGDTYPVPYATASKLPYLDAVIKEAMRMHFIAPITLEREVTGDGFRMPDGRTLPAGSFVGASGFTIHFDKTVFGGDADVFNPDRWLQDPQESSEDYANRLREMRAADMTWGRGSRTCLGKNIAVQEVYKAIATLFGLFDMALVNPEKDWKITEVFFSVQSNMDISIAWRNGKSLESLIQKSE